MQALLIRFQKQVIRLPLPSTEVNLGSSPSNEIAIPFPGVSRIHARLTPTRDGAVLTDLGSKNRLVVNGQAADRVELGPGVSVGLGRAVLTIEEASTGDLFPAYPIRMKEKLGGIELASESRGHVTGPEPNRTADALALVRAIERIQPRSLRQRRLSIMASARDLLRAESLLLFEQPSGRELIIVAAAGVTASSDSLDAISEGVGSKGTRESVVVVPAGNGFVAVAARRHKKTAVGLAASLAHHPAQWEIDFLDYLSSKLTLHDEGVLQPPARETQAGVLIPEGMIAGSSPAMASLLAAISATVGSNLDVLLLGETGTGKEYLSRLIHTSGPTAGGPFVAINCATIPSELLEAELFGVHGRVATGVDPRPGLFARAEGGTIFLDEIAELPDALQAKLLRVLQEREVFPLGAAAPRKIKVRVVAASNRDVSARVREGRFRADLFYRLRGLEFQLPPLRERKQDIAVLALAFAARYAAEYGKRIRGVSRRAMEQLLDHDWPGNIRELQTEIARAVLLCPDGAVLSSEHFRSLETSTTATLTRTARAPSLVPDSPPAAGADDLQGRVDAVERQAIREALSAADGNKSLAARRLGITRNGLAMKMRRLKIH